MLFSKQAIGWNDWRNYVSVDMGHFEIVIGHFQLLLVPCLRPRWPRWVTGGRRLLELRGRWTSFDLAFLTWPFGVSLHWHATCHGCVNKYNAFMEAQDGS